MIEPEAEGPQLEPVPGRTDARFKFAGKERDVGTGYSYFGARYYNVRIGRWLAVDPVVGKASMLSWSPYHYGLNNPMKYLDPDGQEVKVYTERLGLGVYSRAVSGFLSNVPSQYQPTALLFGAAAWEVVGPRHAFMRVTTDGFDKVIELGGPLPGHVEGNPLAPDVKGSLSARPGQEEHGVQRPEGVSETDYSFENKILEIHTTMSNYIKEHKLPTYDGLTGPNSNGYAQFLIEAAGGKGSLPANAMARNVTAQYWQIYQQLLDQEKKKEQEQHQQGEQK